MHVTKENPTGQASRHGATAYWALAGLSLSMLMPSLDTSIANVGLPTLAVAFGASFQQVQWIVLAYLLAITTLIVSAGRLGDVVGRRRMLLFGIGLFTVTSLLCGMAPTIWLLIAARAAQGIGAAIMMALTLALVSEMVPRERTGSAMGLLGSMSAIGTTLGPSLGGVLIAAFGWRMMFFVNVPFGVLSFVLAFRTVPRDRPAASAEHAGFDVPGTLLLALTLSAYALSMTIGRGGFGFESVALLSIAALGAIAFVFVQSRVESPLIRLEMFRDAALRTALVMSGLVSTVMMATLVVGPFYLSRALGLDATHVGLVMSAGPLMATLAGVPAGRFVDRFGAHRMATTGLVGLFAGLLALSVAPGQFGVAGYVAAIVIVTAHYAVFQAANNTGVMTGVAAGQRGLVSGLLSLSRNLGLITGASGMGALFAFASATSDLASASPTAVAAGMRATFMVAAGLVLAALAIGPERPHTGQHDSSVRHPGFPRRDGNRDDTSARRPGDQAVQPEMAAGPRLATETPRAPA